MAVKTTGAEFKRYYHDKEAWPEGWWHEDEELTIDGKQDDEADLTTVSDSAEIVLKGGVVYQGGYETGGPSMEAHFKRWRKAQSVEFLTVEVAKDKAETLIAAITAAGGKVVR